MDDGLPLLLEDLLRKLMVMLLKNVGFKGWLFCLDGGVELSDEGVRAELIEYPACAARGDGLRQSAAGRDNAWGALCLCLLDNFSWAFRSSRSSFTCARFSVVSSSPLPLP